MDNYFKNWFNSLWENNADEYEFYELAKAIKPSITFTEFDKGWQYTTILNYNKKAGWSEFNIAVEGCY